MLGLLFDKRFMSELSKVRDLAFDCDLLARTIEIPM